MNVKITIAGMTKQLGRFMQLVNQFRGTLRSQSLPAGYPSKGTFEATLLDRSVIFLLGSRKAVPDHSLHRIGRVIQEEGQVLFSVVAKSFRTKSAVSIRPGGRPTPTRTLR